MELSLRITRSAASLLNMTSEMLRKRLELKRITKVACHLLESGFNSPSLFESIAGRCLMEQHGDGGWVSVVDTIWNVRFLSLHDSDRHSREIMNGVKYLDENRSQLGLWGRSKRDFDRIPVSGIALAKIPDLVNEESLRRLESLWISEANSLTYKAAYTLMAFRASNYRPTHPSLVRDTLAWLSQNQRSDGSFAPWKEHPVASDTYCTAVALLGLLSYWESVGREVIAAGIRWLMDSQLDSGVWPCHEIEDGAGWALSALYSASNANI